MDEESKRHTDPSAEANLPVRVHGYQRRWSLHGEMPGLNSTYLSVTQEKKASFNGVIYRLRHPDHIKKYDQRETGYCRQELRAEEIELYTKALPPQKQLWIYVAAHPKHEVPTKNYPMVQSYVDLFLRGCIQIEEKFKIPHFARDCIRSTDDWSVHWVNDRIFPRRPYVYEPYAVKIDTLIKQNLSATFTQIKTPQISYSP